MSDLSEAQERAIVKLAPLLKGRGYLAGGIAVALRLHHRTSKDLDFFMPSEDPLTLVEPLAQLPDVQVTSRSEGTLYLEVEGSPVSIIRYRYPLIAKTEKIAMADVDVASVEDLVAMKLSAIASRGALRDFWDLHGLLRARSMSLPDALDLYRRKFQQEDIGHVIRALVYFADADAEPRPENLTAQYWATIKTDLENWVTNLT